MVIHTEPAIGRWSFWPRWVLLTIVGYAVGNIIGFALGHVLLGNVMIGVGIGAATGFFQWLLLRRHLHRSGWWILASVVGLGLSLELYTVVHVIWGYPFDLGWPRGVLGWALAFLLGGVLIGLPQYRILRVRCRRSHWWVPVGAVGWSSSVLGLAIPPEMSRPLPTVLLVLRNGVAGPAVAGLILGAITGVALIQLFRQPAPSGRS